MLNVAICFHKHNYRERGKKKKKKNQKDNPKPAAHVERLSYFEDPREYLPWGKQLGWFLGLNLELLLWTH